ncbi:hypothetical protein QFC22_000693 [Naganishia vaughanmartiniae]|uniref:Uncharacterized protein n=1 Tax=Naganishia vaughanmartiniae TaxID=1424756 RepID=A0ACC2XJU2_9TREE|nr:hypothetical protein QFC22_000693 [Naganishia vaughanmartiniae]
MSLSHPPPEPQNPSPPSPPTKTCSLVGPVALVVQALMAVLVIASLLVKRQYEGGKSNKQGIVVPRRKWKVWVFDVSKQLIGQTLIHGSNLLISDQVAHGGGNNPCSLYFLNVLVDTTIGKSLLSHSTRKAVPLVAHPDSLLLLYRCARLVSIAEGSHKGIHRQPNTYTETGEIRTRISWAKQLGIYLTALLIMKIFVLVLFAFTLDPILLPLAGWILNWMRTWSQVVFVMAIFPLFMNIIQFCLIDSLIKGRELGSDDDQASSEAGYHYTAAPSTAPKDLEEAVDSSSFDHQQDNQAPSPSTYDSLPPPLHHTERGRGKSRESSRASSSSRFRDAVGDTRTPRSATGSSRGLTPLPSTSSTFTNAELGSLKVKPQAGAMSRTRSTDGYGSTGSTEPSPAFPGLTLRDEDEDEDEDEDDGYDGFALGGEESPRTNKATADTGTDAHEVEEPDKTPRPDTGGTFQNQPPPPSSLPPPPPFKVAPKRMNDDARIQARRSLSSEESRVVRRNPHHHHHHHHHRGKQNDPRHNTLSRGNDSETDTGGSVVMLNDV